MLSAQISGFRPYSYLHSSESPFNAYMKIVTTAQALPVANEIPRILESDDHLAWVWKPNHLLVHRTDLAMHDLLNLKDWILETTDWSFAQPINRLDRPTSGLVLVARDVDALKMVSEQFAQHAVAKTYLAIVRGWTEDEGVIEKPLPTSHNSTPKEAITTYKTLGRAELPLAITRYETSRFSLVECTPQTGRFHQIRLHLKHLKHPIIGDTAHGDKPHNRYFAHHLNQPYLLLHSGELTLEHPHTALEKTVQAPLPEHWKQTLDQLGWSDSFSTFGSSDSTQSGS